MTPSGMHVLFVDDENVNRRLGERMLKRLGCSCVMLEDGDLVDGALREAERPFDAILMDIYMQRTDGAAVCQELRERGVFLPIIAMTGTTVLKDVQRFVEAGFDLVLPKPFDINQMGKALLEGRARRARANAQLARAAGGGGTAAPAPAPLAGSIGGPAPRPGSGMLPASGPTYGLGGTDTQASSTRGIVGGATPSTTTTVGPGGGGGAIGGAGRMPGAGGGGMGIELTEPQPMSQAARPGQQPQPPQGRY
jgi:CheY-like chemotaxis protein